jgi:ribonuclease H-related protein
MEKSFIEIYTDGSYNRINYTGSLAFVVVNGDKVIHHHSEAIFNPVSWNINGELEAILEASKWAIKNKYDRVHIWTDLKMAETIFNAKKANPNSDITKKYRNEMSFMKELITIKVLWLKGHSNNTYNDMAHDLAEKLTR